MSEAAKRQMTLGMIVGNRGFFPDHLARSGHQEMRATLELAGVKVVALTEAESKFGAVETRLEARRCADLFKHRSEEHTSELQSHLNLVCRLLLEKKKNKTSDLSTSLGRMRS